MSIITIDSLDLDGWKTSAPESLLTQNPKHVINSKRLNKAKGDVSRKLVLKLQESRRLHKELELCQQQQHRLKYSGGRGISRVTGLGYGAGASGRIGCSSSASQNSADVQRYAWTHFRNTRY